MGDTIFAHRSSLFARQLRLPLQALAPFSQCNDLESVSIETELASTCLCFIPITKQGPATIPSGARRLQPAVPGQAWLAQESEPTLASCPRASLGSQQTILSSNSYNPLSSKVVHEQQLNSFFWMLALPKSPDHGNQDTPLAHLLGVAHTRID